MSQQELLSEIERLREYFSQRRKSVEETLKHLKADYDDQRRRFNRYARLKESYTQYREFFPSEIPLEESLMPDPPPPQHAIIEAERKRLRADSDKLKRVLSALQTAAEALRAEQPDVAKLSDVQKTLSSLQQSHAELSGMLEQYDSFLQPLIDSLNLTFGTTLYNAFAAEGLTLEGRMPSLYIGRFAIKVELTKRSARILYGKEQVGKPVKLSAEAILKAYRAAHKEVAERQENDEQWLKMLYEAWRTVRFRQGTREPSVNIVSCYIELALQRQADHFLRREPRKSLFKEYTRAQFAHDLDLFVIRRRLQHDGFVPNLHTATKSQASSSETSLWVVDGNQPDSGRYYGLLAFNKGS